MNSANGKKVADVRNDVAKQTATVKTKNLDFWLLQNLSIMQKLSIKEPVAWREVDTPG